MSEIQVINLDKHLNPDEMPSIDNIIEESLQQFTFSPPTVLGHREELKKFFKFAGIHMFTDLRNMRIDNILTTVRGYISGLTDNRSRINALAVLKGFFYYLHSVYNYPKNSVGKQIFNIDIPIEIEIIKFLDSLKQNKDKRQKDYRDYLLISTMLTASLRISEVLQVDISQIKTDNITGQNYIEIVQEKNRLRKVIIPRKLLEGYQDYADRYNIEGYLFTSVKNNLSDRDCLTQVGCYKIIRERVKQYIGKEGIDNHSLGKSFIELANKGIKLYEIDKEER